MDSAAISISNSTYQIAMARVKDEFRSILVSVSPAVKNRLPSNEQSSSCTDSDYSSFYSQPQEWMNTKLELIPDEAIHKLRCIAKQMISAGSSRDCVEVYTSVRKIWLDDRFEELRGIAGLSFECVKRLEWRVQQVKIRRWMHAARICVRGLLPAERALTKQIFDGLGAHIADDCFIKTVDDSAANLFNFVEAISSGRKSPEKLFQILHLHQFLSDLLPDVDAIFGSKSGEFIRKKAVGVLSSLSETARGILSEFEKAVFGETSKVPIPEGGSDVLPLTRYVMNYIQNMVEYEQILTQLIVSKPSTSDYIRSSELDFDLLDFEGQASPMVLHLAWIIVALKFNLRGKSKQCKDASLARLFMTNNADYIVQEIKWSVELREMVGDDYQNKLVGLAEANYQQKPTWSRILDCFSCSSF